MKLLILATLAIAALLIAAPSSSLPIANPSAGASAGDAPVGIGDVDPGPVPLMLGLLGLAGLAMAGGRPGERRLTPTRALLAPATALLATLALLLTVSAGATPIISEVFFNPNGADDGGEWVEIFNDGGTPIDLSGYSLGWGGPDYTTGTLQLLGNLLPGQYFVVGGPISDASNGDPVYDQVANFTPDLENSGWFQPADGVALFDMPAGLIAPATVPIDAFIYTGPIFSTNSNGLLDESGAPGAVDFVQPFFASGYSVEFDGATWSRQNSPTPNTGPLSAPEPATALYLLFGLCFLGWAKRDSHPV
jgi:hypothetical protein